MAELAGSKPTLISSLPSTRSVPSVERISLLRSMIRRAARSATRISSPSVLGTIASARPSSSGSQSCSVPSSTADRHCVSSTKSPCHVTCGSCPLFSFTMTYEWYGRSGWRRRTRSLSARHIVLAISDSAYAIPASSETSR
jgi:hypothetical protein